MLLIYNYAFGNSLGGDYGEAAALSLMLVAVLAVFSFIYLRATRSLERPVIATPLPEQAGRRSRARPIRWGRPRAGPLVDRNHPRTRLGPTGGGPAHRADVRTHACSSSLLVIIGLGPILWLAKSAITPTQDTLRTPMALFPHGFAWSNLVDAWTQVDVGLYMWNTIVIAFGSWLVQIVVATTGAYALSVLRPKYGKVLMALVLTTLFVPSVVLLVPLYIEDRASPR